MKSLAFTIGALLLLAGPTASTQVTTFRDRPVFLDSASDIASDGQYLYAVGASHQVIVRRPVDGPAKWELLPTLETLGGAFGQIGGLAAWRGTLFVTDSKASRLAAISTGANVSSGSAVRFVNLPPLRRPESVAVAGGHVFVADSELGIVVRVVDGEVRDELLGLWGERRPGVRLFLSGDGDSLFIGRADGLLAILESVHLAGKAPPRILQRPPSVFGAEQAKSSLPRTYGSEDARPVRPVAASAYAGIVYLVDAADRGVYALDQSSRRAVHIDDLERPILGATRLVATERKLFVLGSGDEIREIERPLPVEVVAERGALPKLIPLLYRYLSERRLLATQRVQAQGGIEETLRRSRLLGGSALPEEMLAVVCSLNRGACTPDGWRGADTEWLILPSWPADSYIDQRPVQLTGERSIEEEMKRRIVSPVFSAWRTPEKIRGLNLGKIPPDRPLSEVRKGTFYLPVDLIRYLIPVPKSDHDKGATTWMTQGLAGVRVRSLTRVSATSSSTYLDVEQDLAAMAQAHETMRAKIKASQLTIRRTSNSPVAKVGVADGYIHRLHPDFGEAFIEDESTPEPPKVPVSNTAAPGEGLPAGEAVGTQSNKPWHDFNIELDHGTAVASIIGARSSRFKKVGLAAGVPLIGLTKDEPHIDKEVKDAFLSSSVPIFNFSFSYKPGEVPTLGQVIDDLPQAFFVVASGSHWVEQESDGKLCERNLVIYPQCYADKPNVLVVTATNIDGTQLLQPIDFGNRKLPGANWNPHTVHLAAPGERFYASGYPEGYVEVRGSSFAAPLVTAAAAALYAEGVTNPVLMKQRLIATADRVPALTAYVIGGLMNVERALAWPTKAVVKERPTDAPRAISLQRSDNLKIANPSGSGSHDVPATNIRRVVRIGAKVRVIYAIPSSRQNHPRVEVPEDLRIVEIAAGNWPIKYREVDPQTLVEHGPKKELNLGTVTDYVGPISR